MKIEFNDIKEFEDFIEKMGYVKENDFEGKNIIHAPKTITLTKKECPYGWEVCPYQKSITPYSPSVTLFNTDVGASQNKELNQNKDKGITIDMKDVKNT